MTTTKKSPLQTATGATGTYTFDDMIQGELMKVDIYCSATTSFKVYTLQDDASTVDEYILGAAGSTLDVATATHLNPQTSGAKTDGSAPLVDVWSAFVVSKNQIKVDASGLTAADTWSIDLTIME